MLLLWAILIWVTGLLTLVPFGTYYLFFHAPRDQYALLIVGILFWIFGYWGVVGPVLAALKIRSVFRALEKAQAQGRLAVALHSQETEEVAIDFIASENRIPRFLAAKVYRRILGSFSTAEIRPTGVSEQQRKTNSD